MGSDDAAAPQPHSRTDARTGETATPNSTDPGQDLHKSRDRFSSSYRYTNQVPFQKEIMSSEGGFVPIGDIVAGDVCSTVCARAAVDGAALPVDTSLFSVKPRKADMSAVLSSAGLKERAWWKTRSCLQGQQCASAEFLFPPRATGAWLKKSCEHGVSCTQQMRCCYKDRCHFLRRMPAVVFILIFCVTGTQSETTDWPINLPQKLTAEEGLCVIIPCSFSNPENKLQPPFTGIWLKTEQPPQKTVFHSSGPSKVSEEYRGRVALLGNLTENQCTVIISDLRKRDGGTYQFRVEGKRQNAKNTYKKKCNIIINDLTQKPTLSPVSVTEGELATLTCTAPGRCSGTPPTITWKTKPDLKGIETHKSEISSDGTTTHSSDFIFWPVPKHNKAVISCEVKFTNTTTQEKIEESVTLEVKYAPRILNGSGCTTVGDRLTCVCISQGHPLPSIEWREVTVTTDTPLSVSTASPNQSINSTIVLSANATANSVLCVSINEMGEVRRQLYGSNTINGSGNKECGLITWPGVLLGLFLPSVLLCYCIARARKSTRKNLTDQRAQDTLQVGQALVGGEDTYTSLDKSAVSSDYDTICKK
ncbi:sialic acid-binding Ig-like lectin 14 [Amia ocellicauda]|uniref:sialic acid-binding Ig-like lectin 14 n=1 Tax=Amia ocellicauda TaxID=2972642 RepID=UPI0034639B0E